MHSEKVVANRTEKVGAFIANKTKKGGFYRSTYPYCFNMGVPPPVIGLVLGRILHGVAIGHVPCVLP